MKLNGKKIAILIILVLFLAGLFFRVQLDGLNPTHPGNLKAANAFYHVIAADHVANTGEIFGNPSWDAEGHNDVTSIVAQHQAVMIAPLIKLTGIEEWNLSYLIVVILSALAIPITYMLTRRLFKSEITSIIAAGLIVIPIQITNWLYYLYIGIWLQSSVTPFLLLSIVFIIDLFKELKLWKIVALSITTTATFLMFPPVMIFFFPLLLVILWKILTEKIENKEKIKKFIGYAIIPIISLIIFMPILMFGDLGSASQDEKLFEFGPPNYESAPFAKGIESIPWILLIFGGYGLLLLLMNYKKYKGVILWMAYMGAILYILPYFMHGHTGYYLLRMRGGFLIYLLAPIIAYGIYHLGIKNISKVFKSKLILTILALILLIGVTAIFHQQI